MTQESVGERLRRLREARGLKQRDLAEPGISGPYISRIEQGSRRPSLRALRRLAAKLGVTPEYLETGAPETTTDRLVAEIAEAGFREFTVIVSDYVHVRLGGTSISGVTLTHALERMVEFEREAQRLADEAERIEAAKRELEERRAGD